MGSLPPSLPPAKRFFNFSETLHSCSSRKINFRLLGKFDVSFAKSEKNPIPSFFSKKNYFGFPFIFFYKGILCKMNTDQISRELLWISLLFFIYKGIFCKMNPDQISREFF